MVASLWLKKNSDLLSQKVSADQTQLLSVSMGPGHFYRLYPLFARPNEMKDWPLISFCFFLGSILGFERNPKTKRTNGSQR